MKINRFIDRNVSRISIFEEMVRNISKETNLSRDSISSVGEEALRSWEEATNRDPQRLFFQSKEVILVEIDKMIQEFREKITPMIDSDVSIKKSVDLFQDSLGKMFEI
ncbi:hypothetical protein NEF87_002788 [Candidatus Lokiarchaeum ossiferum]|uniref:Uncharacterized protein n=1 Tax=Candidatus Lokiarchaeum ossiferum TaxID=2951803 RepID=A0ABY6HT27_9ARCH|nr:hypothetical protein NEF87_002788 [Candidatus Lokiarchaeum sp. B-35]